MLLSWRSASSTLFHAFQGDQQKTVLPLDPPPADEEQPTRKIEARKRADSRSRISSFEEERVLQPSTQR